MTSRVLAVLYTKKQLRTFIETNAFMKLSKTVQVDYLIYGDLNVEALLANERVFYVMKPPSWLQRSGTLVAASKLWSGRFISRAHFFRAVASFSRKGYRSSRSSMILYDMNGWSEMKRAIVRILSIKFVFYISRTIRDYFVRKSLRRLISCARIEVEDYSYAIIPYSGLLSPEFDDVVKFFQFKGVPTVAVQENWDNLSSKTFIDSQPDFFLVWGQQSLGHLSAIHQLSSTKKYIVGSPRFREYSTRLQLEGKLDIANMSIQKKYVLFTGTGDGIDDSYILSVLLEALKSLKNELILDIVYRPHPFTRNEISELDKSNFLRLGVLIDDASGSKEVFHHCSLVMHAELIVNQFSTILVEGLFCYKKILLPCFVDRRVDYDYSGAIDEWHHFIGLRTAPNVYIAESKEDFESVLKQALRAKTRVSKTFVNWIISPDLFEDRLLHFHGEYFDESE